MTLSVFTSGRDMRPQAFFPGRVPAEARYVRVLVLAHDIENAAARLEVAGLRRYVETLRPATSADGPAQAVRDYADYAEKIDEFPAFVVYAVDQDPEGATYRAPRFYLTRVVGDSLVLAGRLRVVDRGNPTDPRSVVRAVADDHADDPVPMPDEAEGEADTVGLVEGVLPYPAGPLGDSAREIDGRLVDELVRMQDRIDATIREIRSARSTTNPAYAWMRDSAALLAMSSDLAKLAGGAQVVELVLRSGPR